MKTKFIKTSALHKDFQKDLSTLIEGLKTYYRFYVDFFLTLKEPITYPLSIKNFTASSGESFETASKSILIVNLILDQLAENRDTIENFINDIDEMHFIKNEKDYNLLKKFFLDIKSSLPYFIELFKKLEAASLTLPKLKGSEMSVSIRPVFDRNFTYGEDDITSYIPIPKSLVAVVQIRLQSTDDDSTFCFQLNDVQIDNFISNLLALQAQYKETLKVLNNVNINLQKDKV